MSAAVVVGNRSAQDTAVGEHRHHIAFGMKVIVSLIVRHRVGRNRGSRLRIMNVADEIESPFRFVVFRAVGGQRIALANTVTHDSSAEIDRAFVR